MRKLLSTMLKADRENVYREIETSQCSAVLREIKVHAAVLYQEQDA